MRRLLLFLLGIIVSVTNVNAGKVTEQQALQKARQFMKGKNLSVANLKALTRSDQSISGDAFYIFNAENKGGFVIVSGDDRTVDILGFSDKGNIDVAKIPDNLEWLLQYYNKVITSLSEETESGYTKNSTRLAQNIVKTEIAPLVRTQWGQNAPYNTMCPVVNGQHCITGCVATAMAQIINYNKWPEGNTNTVDAYTTITNEIKMSQLDATSFNWDNMTNNDIARLMLYCGQSAKMDYDLDASGAAIEPALFGFINVFGYSKTARVLNREGYDNDDNNWDNILYEELSSNRPLIYTGGNHAWLIDGYKDGAFHMNWGWNGDVDGYFRVSGIAEGDFMNSYTWAQCALIGISRPVTIESDDPIVIVTEMNHSVSSYTGIAELLRPSKSEDFQEVTVNCCFISDLIGDIYIGFGLVDEDGQLLKVFSSEQHTFADDETYRYYGSVTLGKDIVEGSYRIVALCSKNGIDWQLAMQANCEYINVTISEDKLLLEIMPNWHSEADPDYKEVGVYDINGVTYLLYYWHDNYLAKVLPYHKTGKYSGEVVVPNEVEFNGQKYRVFYDEQAFNNCEELTSLKIAISHPDGVWNCPNLTSLILEEGVDFCSIIDNLPSLESIELPSTLSQTNSPQFISNCKKLKTIRFKGSLMSFREIPEWDENSLPALTEIYFPSETPFAVADWNENPLGDVPVNPNATIHIPVGSLGLYKQSAWKQWKFVEDMPAPSVIKWGYCHRDAVTNQGTGGSSSNNDLEYAMRVPVEELTAYKGCQITQIQVFSPSRSTNDYHDEDYEYVFITKPGTDYIIKQPFNVVRGTWNTVSLDTPYTINDEALFVGVGRHGGLSIRFSDLTNQQDAVWYRAMGDDYGCAFEPGEWVEEKRNNHPLPLRFAIEGDNVPQGVIIRELSLNESGTTMQGVLRNRSLEGVSSVTIEWTIDGSISNKTYETHLAPNGSETITFDLPESIKEGYHKIKADVTAVNGANNGLAGLYAIFETGTPTFKTKEGVVVSYKILSEKDKTCQIGNGAEASIDQSTPGTVTIPNEVNGYKVIGIGDYGFYNCAELTTIWLPEGLEFIGKYAFYGCTKLRTIKIPDTVTAADKTVFLECPNIEEIETPYLPNIGEIIGNIPSNPRVVIKPRKKQAEQETGLEEVVIPKPVTSIGERAFGNLPSVRLMRVEEGNSVFDSRDNCNAIVRTEDDILLFGCQSTKIPVSVKGIESYAFEGHVKLAAITLPKDIASIGEAAFIGCSELMNIVSRIKVPFAINDNTFSNETYANATLTVPYGTKEIYSKTDGWKNFVNIVESENRDIVFADAEVKRLCVENWDTDGDGELSKEEAAAVKDLGEVFKSNKTITSFDELQYFEGLDKIGRIAFLECVSLASVVIPSSVKTLCYGAFFHTGLTSIDIPNTVETIEEYVFDGCKGLKSVFIPKSVSLIKYNLFKNCSNLESITVAEDNPMYNSKNGCNAIVRTEDNVLVSGCKNTKILNGITAIGGYAFQGCDGLITVELPSSVTDLDVYSFSYCPNLSKMVVLCENPAKVNIGAFEDLPSSATLYVPVGSKEKYLQADGWKEFKNIVEVGETAPVTIGKSGKASYCGDQSLDFSFSEEIKAYIATGFDETEGTIWLTRVKDVPANTPVLVKGEKEKTYQVPVTDSKNSYYKNMFKGNISGAKIQIPETENGLVNYYLSGDGTFKKVKNYANIGNNKSYLQLPGTFAAPAAGATQTVTIKSSGKASYAAPVDLDFTNVEGLKAFTATGYDKSSKTIWLTRVMKVQKGEGVLLKGDAKDYEIPSAAVQSSYMNMFVGNTSGDKIQVQEKSEDGSQTNYYLKGDGSFVSVNGFVNIGNNKCYLELPTSMVAVASTRGAEVNYILEEPEIIKMSVFRSIGNDGDGTTGIKDQSSKFNVQSDNAYYTLQGQRVMKPGKGIYIRNGKIVFVKNR